KGEHGAPRSGIAAQACDHKMRHGVEHLRNEVVNGVNIAPGFECGIGGGLNDIEVDSVGEEIAAAKEHNHPRGLASRKKERVAEAIALLSAHRAIVEIEVKTPDRALLHITDLAKCPVAGLCVDWQNGVRNFSGVHP